VVMIHEVCKKIANRVKAIFLGFIVSKIIINEI